MNLTPEQSKAFLKLKPKNINAVLKRLYKKLREKNNQIKANPNE